LTPVEIRPAVRRRKLLLVRGCGSRKKAAVVSKIQSLFGLRPAGGHSPL